MASLSSLSANFIDLPNIKACKRSQSSAFHPLCGTSKPINESLQYLRTNFKTASINKRSKKQDFAIYSSPPDTGGLFPFWPPTENSWTTWLVGLVAVVPLVIQRLLTLTKQVENTAETVEEVVDSVENVAEKVENLAEDVSEKLPEGSKLKNAVDFVENAAEETEKDAQLAEDLLDKVEEVDLQLESILNNGSKATVKEEAHDQK